MRNLAAAIAIGVMAFLPMGASAQPSEAQVNQLHDLANNGAAEAQNMLGSLYYGGIGVPQSYDQSYIMFRNAAEQGHADAQYNLSNMYLRGEGTEQDSQRAYFWSHKSAQEGHARAQLGLGAMYIQGNIVQRDYITGYMWTTIASFNGEANSLHMIELLETAMEDNDIYEAQRRATACMGSGYTDCD
ncbi:tetratricopeptide repeat protein [Fodinicurvata sp. EGI_FJ10296]|uniref:tetratricopeptide repeat protein n=1 Tax=Fodinicurvata sp. EGI_FJ10296 TaxID=3231908 RepID=UPI0034516E2A